MSDLIPSLPLFPLPTVLSMGQLLPLYVFEERYRALLRRIQETGEPFGIVCIEQSGSECDLPLHQRVSLVGTLAHLVHAERHEDGTSSIVVCGGERFRVGTFDLSQPYLSADVECWPLAAPDAEAVLCAVHAERLLAKVQRTWPQYAALLRCEAPREPQLVASYVSQLLAQRGQAERLACNAALQAPTLAGRLERLLASLPETVFN